MYRPLPKTLTIYQSTIEGLGLFSTEVIPANTDLGITHIYDDRFPQGLIRLPLGGFFNHSEDPNCEVQEHLLGENGTSFKHLRLVTIKEIAKGEELTARYTLYDPTS